MQNDGGRNFFGIRSSVTGCPLADEKFMRQLLCHSVCAGRSADGTNAQWAFRKGHHIDSVTDSIFID